MSNLSSGGLSRVLTYLKTWITGLLNGKSDTSHTHSDYIPKSGGAVITGTFIGRNSNGTEFAFCGGIGWGQGSTITLYGKDESNRPGWIVMRADDSTAGCELHLKNDGTATWGGKNLAMQEDVIPRTGGAVLGAAFERSVANDELRFTGGNGWNNGASIVLCGKSNVGASGLLRLRPINDSSWREGMFLYPNGTWTWDGQAVQLTSDQRLKQQIATINDKLLDAWEDVLLCQFKYNDAVEQKGDTARLHTGYVVQQIDEACKSHNLDISAYGLYCHEEYPERIEEVEVKQDDGSIIKETKVIEPAKEYYSLRYTEALIVECAYLRREVKRLSERLEKLEK